MNKATRAAIAALAALGTLVFASAAFASFTPKLVVSGTGTGGAATRVGVIVGANDAPTAKVTIFIPSGYTVGTPAAGTKLGDVTATASAADLGGAVLPLTGELDAIAPTSTTAAAAQQCGVSPNQTWNLALTAAGQTLNIPVFVVTAAGPVAASGFGSELVVCLPPPDVPAGTPGRATFGAKLLSATFSSNAIIEPSTAGDYRWTSTWTPYNPGVGTVNAAGTVEVQSLRHLPVKFAVATARKRVVVHKTVRVKGKKKSVKIVATAVGIGTAVLENGKAPSSETVSLTVRGKKVGTTRGSFVMVGIKSVVVVATAVIDSDTGSVPTGQTPTTSDLFYHDLGASGCTATPIFQGLPCIDATVGGERLSKLVKVLGYTK